MFLAVSLLNNLAFGLKVSGEPGHDSLDQVINVFTVLLFCILPHVTSTASIRCTYHRSQSPYTLSSALVDCVSRW
jgi:hypothetical protein